MEDQPRRLNYLILKNMKRLLRKAFLIVVLFATAFINTDCKKQKRCGCGKDVLFPLEDEICYVYFSDETSTITMMRAGDYYSNYTFCNPDEIRPKLENVKYGAEMVVSGDVFWDCSYVWQESNSYSYSSYRSYTIIVKDIYVDLYGRGNLNEDIK